MSLGMSEILLIILAIVILFGGKKIPELARALGRASYEFKKARESIENEVKSLKESAEKEAKQADSKSVSIENKEANNNP
ncbi:MAG: twin-arginine translocase TatA/TatE family subunit [Endomicrobia bacterium]|nr:twin-arginine translocase TatA/TatE family subunit [Endomicrobiia bacterium]